MRLYLNSSDFISVIGEEGNYSCQPMTLVNGKGMGPASVYEDPKDVVSCIMDSPCRHFATLKEVFDYHRDCLLFTLVLTEADYFNGDESDNFLQ